MRVVMVVVGKRTEHWASFFDALARQRDTELLLQTADISPLARKQLARLADRHPNVHFHEAKYWIGEDATGHMASVLFAPGSWRWLHEARPDVIHVIGEASYLATRQTIGFRNRVFPRTPISLYAAQNVVMRLPPPFTRFERYAYRQVALALPITPAARSVLRAKGYRGKAKITPLGVDVAHFRPRRSVPEGPFTVGFAGRLEPHKGLLHLVAASDRIGCRLLLVGDGSLRPWLQGEAARRAGRIELHPWQTHDALARILRRLHALVLPSVETVQRGVVPWSGIPLREQFGRVLLEAMACGVPVIGTTVGEIPHVIGAAGLTVPPESPAALAEAMARLRERPALAASLARSGVERAALFDWNRIADGVRAAWDEVACSPLATLPRMRTITRNRNASHWPSRRESHGRAV
ncbi:MAG: glycosyltransferase family 4 protein [Actinomycetota bacterium]